MNLVFFTDRDLGSRFPEILAAAGLTVERHRDHFAHDCADEVWLETIGQRGWVALTHNRRIRYQPNELDAVVRHKVALLVIVGDAPYPDLANAFVLCRGFKDSWLKIIRLLSVKCIDPRPPKWLVNSSRPGELSRGIPNSSKFARPDWRKVPALSVPG